MCLRTLSREGGVELSLLFNLSLFFPLGGPLCTDKFATRRRASGAMPPASSSPNNGLAPLCPLNLHETPPPPVDAPAAADDACT
ncbi:hypothetical protein MRX96_034669 [Rhipicephalus microplus]